MCAESRNVASDSLGGLMARSLARFSCTIAFLSLAFVGCFPGLFGCAAVDSIAARAPQTILLDRV
ncbi:hypothetical protein ACFO3J_35315 [Streptomyces polygonati]|uniref:Lipoprotein n=1 Tax=Streptomyces polygonati TaxID=1617087 RepID=A0ABV8I0J6_9ACTN